MTKTISSDRIAAARLVVSRMLGLKPGHASEAIAASLGHNTHAALGAALRVDGTVSRTPDARRFRTRLTELGHGPEAADADAALTVAFGIVPRGASDRNAATGLLQVADYAAAAWMELAVEQPAAGDLIMPLRPIPDAAVRTMLVGKDTVRWNPAFVGSLLFGELKFLLAAAALHRAAAHPLRRGERDPDLWRAACEYVVNDFLVDARIGDLPMSGFYDKRFPSSMLAEDVYDQLAGETRSYKGMSTFGFQPWKAKAPAQPPTVSEVAGGRLRRLHRQNAFGVPGLDCFAWDRTPDLMSLARASKGDAPGAGRKDANSASFGRHLASLVADLPDQERAPAVASALGEVRDAYRSACFDALLKAARPALRR